MSNLNHMNIGGTTYGFQDDDLRTTVTNISTYVNNMSGDLTDLEDDIAALSSSVSGINTTLSNWSTYTQSQADWANTSTASAQYIQNKPTISSTVSGSTANLLTDEAVKTYVDNTAAALTTYINSTTFDGNYTLDINPDSTTIAGYANGTMWLEI